MDAINWCLILFLWLSPHETLILDIWPLWIIWFASWYWIWLWVYLVNHERLFRLINLFMGLFIPLVHYLFGLDSRQGIAVHSRFKIKFISRNSKHSSLTQFQIKCILEGKMCFLEYKSRATIQGAISITKPSKFITKAKVQNSLQKMLLWPRVDLWSIVDVLVKQLTKVN